MTSYVVCNSTTVACCSVDTELALEDVSAMNSLTTFCSKSWMSSGIDLQDALHGH